VFAVPFDEIAETAAGRPARADNWPAAPRASSRRPPTRPTSGGPITDGSPHLHHGCANGDAETLASGSRSHGVGVGTVLGDPPRERSIGPQARGELMRYLVRVRPSSAALREPCLWHRQGTALPSWC